MNQLLERKATRLGTSPEAAMATAQRFEHILRISQRRVSHVADNQTKIPIGHSLTSEKAKIVFEKLMKGGFMLPRLCSPRFKVVFSWGGGVIIIQTKLAI